MLNHTILISANDEQCFPSADYRKGRNKMFRLLGKLIKFVIVFLIIVVIFSAIMYVGSEVLDIEFCEDILEGMEDFFEEIFDI